MNIWLIVVNTKADLRRKCSADSNDVNLQNIPLIISGPLKSPKASLDKAALLKGVLKKQIQSQLDDAVKKLQLKLFQ